MSRILTPRLALLFLLPGALLLVAFLLVPAIWSVGQSFTNFTLLGPQALETHFNGLENYLAAVRDPDFWHSFAVSLEYVVGSAIVGQVGCGLLLALLTARQGERLGQWVRSLAILAWITPAVVVAILWSVFLHPTDGTLNRLLALVGVSPRNWLLDHPMLSLVLYNTWRGTAFSMLLFDAALKGIPVSFYEAAAVSGATAWRQFWDVTLPMLRPQLVTDLMLITLWTFNDFSPYLLTGGGPAFSTEVLPIYTYRVAFRSFELGYGAALSTLVLLMNLVLAAIYLRSMKAKP